jgi:ATP-binding protein involved in chromosome partitioning
LVKHIKLDGVVIVTTPQDLSLLDAARSLLMFQQAQVPILGVVENMSYFVCPSCNEKHEIFQRSSKWRPSVLADVPLLGRVPLTSAISQGINSADPLMHQNPDNGQAQAFVDIVNALQTKLKNEQT